MTNLEEKASGAAKEVVGEVLGDGRLAEEGRQRTKAQEAASERKEPEGPFEGLQKLT